MEAHIRKLDSIQFPHPCQRIHVKECCISFDTPKSPGGLYVDMTSFLAFGKDYVGLNYEKTLHPVYLHIEETQNPVSKGGLNNNDPEYQRNYQLVILPDHVTIPLLSEELPKKVTLIAKLVIVCCEGNFQYAVRTGDENNYQFTFWTGDENNYQVTVGTGEENNYQVTVGTGDENNYQDGVGTGDEIFFCKHIMDLKQLDNGVMIPPSGWKCEMCNRTNNLWLNLTDGSINCGPSTSSDHCAFTHYDKTKYPIFVNLETITADIEAVEVMCYEECEVVLDTLLAQHLQHFGIDCSSSQKTEPTTAEKELTQNTSFDRKCIEEGVESLSARGYTGLINLGNSSYLSAIMQVVFSTRSFCSRYYINQPLHFAFATSPVDPMLDLNLQLMKLANVLMSGKYSTPATTNVNRKRTEHDTSTIKQDGISPRRFKSLIVGNHPQFSKPYEQDASEFFLHFIDRVRIFNAMNPESDPTRCFKFCIEDRYQQPCGKVTYSKSNAYVLSVDIHMQKAVNKVVPLMHCLDCFTGPEEIHDSASTSSNIKTIKTTSLASFPDCLAVQLQRFIQKDGWDPVKLDVCVDVPETIDISHMRSKGHLPGEELLPSPASSEDTVSQLVKMGIPDLLSRKAAMNTSNAGKEAAMIWLLHHMRDTDINDPVKEEDSVEDPLPDGEGIYRLYGVVSHIGETLHTDHYVAYIHENGRWMIFDDERVAVAKNPPMNTGYMYFFRRAK